MRKKYVLFDMDGVLLDSEYGAFYYLQRWLKDRGYEVEMQELLSKIGKTSREIAAELIRDHHIPMSTDEFMAARRQSGSYYADDPDLKEMPGLYTFIDALEKRNVKLGVVSSTSGRNVLNALNRLALIPRLQVIVCGDMLEKPKPAPDGYLLAAKLLGANPEECVVIEDTPIGIRAGKAAGMRVVGFKGSQIIQDTSEADMEFRKYSSCINAIDQILE